MNGNDRIIRLYDTRTMTLLHEFMDVVNRLQWTACTFSSDGEHVITGSSRDHNLYMWNTALGNLIRILEGTKEPVLGLQVCVKRWLL